MQIALIVKSLHRSPWTHRTMRFQSRRKHLLAIVAFCNNSIHIQPKHLTSHTLMGVIVTISESPKCLKARSTVTSITLEGIGLPLLLFIESNSRVMYLWQLCRQSEVRQILSPRSMPTHWPAHTTEHCNKRYELSSSAETQAAIQCDDCYWNVEQYSASMPWHLKD